MTEQTERIDRGDVSIRELAERIGKSPRTIARWTSESREEYLSRAAERHRKVRELRAEGMTMRAIAEELGISLRSVHYAIHHAKNV